MQEIRASKRSTLQQRRALISEPKDTRIAKLMTQVRLRLHACFA